MEFRDLKAQYKRYKSEINAAIQEVLQEASFIEERKLKSLKRLADYVGVKHCISCANGTETMTC